MKLRNPLFAPANSERKAAKALASAADAVILDLEDSVAPAAKDAARAAAARLLASGSGRPGLLVRVNPRDTAWYLHDLAAVVPAGPAAILLPKCTGPADLVALDHHLEALEAASGRPVGAIGVLALVTETAASLRNLDYAGVTPRLRALAFGAEDSRRTSASRRATLEARLPRRSRRRAPPCSSRPRRRRCRLDTPWPDPRDARGARGGDRHGGARRVRRQAVHSAGPGRARGRGVHAVAPSRCAGRPRCGTCSPPTRARA